MDWQLRDDQESGDSRSKEAARLRRAAAGKTTALDELTPLRGGELDDPASAAELAALVGFIEPRAMTGELAPAREAPGRRTLLEVELARAAEQPMLPAPAALRYARWLLAADRGWTEVPSTIHASPGDAQTSTRQRRELLVALQRAPRPTPSSASIGEAVEPMASAQPWHGGRTRPAPATAPAMRLAARGAASARDPEQLEDVLALIQRCGDGVPLSAELAARMQAELGHAFAQVRVHLGAEAAEACAAIGAEAFTLGHHIYFGAGQFAPDTDDGSRLLRHELTHVVQHARGELTAGSRAELLSPSSSAEAEARAAEAPRPRAALSWAGGPEPAPAQLEERRRRAAAAWDTTLEQPPAPHRRAVDMPTWAGAPMTSGADPAAAATTGASATAIARRAAAPAAAPGGDSGPAAALPTVVTLTGTFAPPSNVAAHIDKAGEAGAAVKVALPKLTKPAVILVKKVEGRYVTVEDKPQLVPLSHPLFVRAGAIAPMLRVRIGAGQDNVVTGYIAAGPTGADPGALQSALSQDLSALGLRGFAIPSLALVNSFENGVLTFGTGAEVGFTLGGWVNGQLSLGLSNDKVTFAARAAIHAKGLKEAEISFTRNANGKISGSAAIGTDLGPHFTGNVNARYDNGDITVRGELGYQSEKLSGKLSVMLADAAQAEAMVNAELPPDSVLPAGGAGAAPAAPAAKGKRGLAGTGNLNFAFTDWLTGTAKVVYGPSGHLTVIGKIAPPKQIELMKQKGINQPILPEVRLQAGYGIPYVADIHVGVGVGLSASAGLGPIVLTDMALDGIYSTDPKVLNKFSITGTLRAQADAGLQLSVKGYAGLTLLGHSINFGAEVLGKAGVKGYAEARTTLGYRETAAPSAGKKGEYYLQGHLEMAAQPVLSLGGNLFIQLDSPWWSPAPSKMWRWPLGSLEYPVPAQFGIGADIDYVIGSGKLPDFKLTKPSFDASKFVDSMMSNRLPARSGNAGKQNKPGTWSGQKPSRPTDSRPAVQPKTPKDATVTAGSPSGKRNQGNQTAEEKKQTPADPAVAKRWNEGMEALGQLQRRAEKDPETKDEITQHLAEIKAKYGFTRLTATRSGQVWLVDAVMNPEHKVQIQADKKDDGAEADTSRLEEVTLDRAFIVKDRPAVGRKLAMTKDEMRRQIGIQERALNDLTVAQYLANWERFYGPQDDESAAEGRADEAQAARDREAEIDALKDSVIIRWRKNNPGKSLADAEAFVEELFEPNKGDRSYPFKHKTLVSTTDGVEYVNEAYGKSILHATDQGAGGGSKTAGLGGSRENFSIGAQWGRGGRAKALNGLLNQAMAKARTKLPSDKLDKLRLNVKLPVVEG